MMDKYLDKVGSIRILASISLLILLSSNLFAQDAADDPFSVQPALIGQNIPDVTVLRADSSTVSLAQITSQKPTILIYYRGGWCPYCNRHMAELQTIEDDLVDLGYQLLAISADRPSRLPASMQKHDLDYTLLSDHTMESARQMGLAYTVDPATVKKYKANGIDLEAASGLDHHQLPVPAVYIVSTDGTLLFNYVNPDYHRRVPSEVLKAAAESFIDEAKAEMQ